MGDGGTVVGLRVPIESGRIELSFQRPNIPAGPAWRRGRESEHAAARNDGGGPRREGGADHLAAILANVSPPCQPTEAALSLLFLIWTA